MRVPLGSEFLSAPLAHRGLHDRAKGVIENSCAAVTAALDRGYGIEMDIQLSADGEAIVFHDDHLDRLTAETGLVRERTAAELGRIPLKDGRGEVIPTLAEVLDIAAGRVPLLIELKDQSLTLSEVDGRLERRVARLLSAYDGPVAVMSFNSSSVEHLAKAAPEIARGRVTCAFLKEDWPDAAEERRAELARIDDLDALGASFISHQHDELEDVRHLMNSDTDILAWTIRSLEAEHAARRIASNITFEGYLA